MSTQASSPEANIRLVRSGCVAFNANDLDACVELLAEDLVLNLAGLSEPLRGRDSWREGAAMIKGAFPDLLARIDDIVAGEDRVAVRVTMQGTHRGDYLGFPASGRTVTYISHEFYRVADGRIAEEWICSDTATLFQQIG